MKPMAPGKPPYRIWRSVGLALLVVLGAAIAIARLVAAIVV
jgi:hypothetical protein